MLQEEWKILYETYYRQLYLYALSLAGNKHDAEDLIDKAGTTSKGKNGKVRTSNNHYYIRPFSEVWEHAFQAG